MADSGPMEKRDWKSEFERARVQVARLEGEKAALAAALRDTGEDAHSAYMDRNRFPKTQHSGRFMDCPTALCTNRRAALSDTGEGWPKVREQAHKALVGLRRSDGHFDGCHPHDDKCDWLACAEARDALERLEVK